MKIAENISTAWVLVTFEQKQRLQRLVFPEGILYNKEKGVVRTEKVNSLFGSIQLLQRVVEENKKGNLEKDYLEIAKVPTKGIEPSHPCEWQILSLLRLPIPPHGLMLGCKYNSIKLIQPKFDSSIFFGSNILLLATTLLV